MKRLLLFILTVLTLVSTADAKKKVKGPKNLIDDPKEMAVQYAESELKRFPSLYLYDYGRVPFFAEEWCDTLCMDDGTIQKRAMETYNLDLIRGGWVVCDVYNLIKENPDLVGGEAIAQKKLEKYKKCMEMQLIKQLKNHPKTCDGGFWHKLVYPHQMWLDGIYMASPFMAIYGKTFNHPEWQAEALQQVITCWHHTYDAHTGLLHHAWDESASQRWSDAEGHSPNFWGRSVGWYLMAMVDILDYIPEGFTSQFNCGRKGQGREDLGVYKSPHGQWAFYAATRGTDGVMRFYQGHPDGNLYCVADDLSDIAFDTGMPFYIGQDGRGAYRHPFVGDVDEFAIWTRTLSHEEVRRIFDAGLAGKALRE